jgi:hypothetical protein
MAGEKTRDAWILAAQTLGLGFARGTPPTGAAHSVNLRGDIEGFPVEANVRHSDKSTWTDFIIETGGLPPGFKLRRRTLTRLSFMPRRGVKTGDPAWDAAMVVKAHDPQAAEAFLTAGRRYAITTAFIEKPRPRIFKDRIKITHMSLVKNESVITGTVGRLTRLADALDLTPPMSSLMAAPTTRGFSASLAWTIVAWVMVVAIAMTWIFGAGELDPIVLVAISGGALLIALLAFSRARGSGS